MKVIHSIALLAIILTSLDLLAASPIPAEKPAPQTGNGDGHGNGSSFRPADSNLSLRYPAPAQFGSYGTISAWINLDDPASASGAILSAGSPDAGWVLLQVAGKKLSFLLQRGVKPYVGDGECYLNLSTPIDSWAPGSWHHIAAAWDARGPSQSLAAIFIDGQLVEERNTVSLAEGWGPEILFVGSSSANASAPRIAGTIDDVAIFPFAVPPDQMPAVMGGNAAGAALYSNFESGSDAEDLRPTSDDAAARAESRAKWSK
ncbi:hypothetical protein BH09VER1_BH09VER1_55700 [soil metagenome]